MTYVNDQFRIPYLISIKLSHKKRSNPKAITVIVFIVKRSLSKAAIEDAIALKALAV